MDFLWDLFQEVEIAELRRNVADARQDAARTSNRAVDRFNTLLLANAAMWSLMKEKLGVTDAQLKQRMHELDAADGKVDGKLGRRQEKCPGCGRTAPATRGGECMYCGAKLPNQGPFDGAA